MSAQFRSYEDLIKAAGVQNYNFRAEKAQPTPRTLYCRRALGTSAIAANTKLKFFHKGLGDDMANFGGTAGQTANLETTNLQSEGRLAQGELFICTGLAFELPHDVEKATLLGLAEATITWSENANTVRKALGQFMEFPPQVAEHYILRGDMGRSGSSGAVETTAEERLVRMGGRAYMTGAPLFYIRGGVEKHDQGYLELENLTAFTPASAKNLRARLYGIYFQRLQGG